MLKSQTRQDDISGYSRHGLLSDPTMQLEACHTNVINFLNLFARRELRDKLPNLSLIFFGGTIHLIVQRIMVKTMVLICCLFVIMY